MTSLSFWEKETVPSRKGQPSGQTRGRWRLSPETSTVTEKQTSQWSTTFPAISRLFSERETAPSGSHREVTRPVRPHSRSPPCHSHPGIRDPASSLPTTLRAPSPSFWRRILAPILYRFNSFSRLDMAFHVALQLPPENDSADGRLGG